MPTQFEGVNRKSTMMTVSSNATKIERMATEEENKFGESSFSQNQTNIMRIDTDKMSDVSSFTNILPESLK